MAAGGLRMLSYNGVAWGTAPDTLNAAGDGAGAEDGVTYLMRPRAALPGPAATEGAGRV